MQTNEDKEIIAIFGDKKTKQYPKIGNILKFFKRHKVEYERAYGYYPEMTFYKFFGLKCMFYTIDVTIDIQQYSIDRKKALIFFANKIKSTRNKPALTCKMERLKNNDIKCECGAIYKNPVIYCRDGCGKESTPVPGKI